MNIHGQSVLAPKAGSKIKVLYYRSEVTNEKLTPASYQPGGQGAVIRFAVRPCPFGHLLVAATEQGICSVRLGDEEEALEASLQQEFPAAELRRDEAGIEDWMQTLLEHVAGRQRHLDLPLDVQSTDFQRRVWQALRAIPYGETRTYSQIAEAIGQPGAARAVGRACATNTVALIIPCHRAVRGDRSISGFRWGSERKQRLLQHEAQNSGQMSLLSI
jgi:AraC family transcriptional regulator of adaptative response/methylated-DNA-[protein]-cysteine methyltransferase